MNPSDASIDQTIDSAQEEIRQLRARLDALLADNVKPVLHDAAAHVGDTAERLRKVILEEADTVAAFVRERPLTAVAAALAVGFLLARLTR